MTPKPRRIRAVTMIEALIAVAIFTFIVSAIGLLFNAVYKQQQLARNLSRGLTDLRSGFVVLTRVGRHAYRVVESTSSFGNAASSASQLIIEVPEPTGTTPATVLIRFYVTGGTLYKQRAGQSDPGTPLLDNVSSVAFRYFYNQGGTRSELPATLFGLATTIGSAREIEATVVTLEGGTSVRDVASILLRNVYSDR
ncbi:MAG: type II secretion system protein J [Armatimonadota bacterium]